MKLRLAVDAAVKSGYTYKETYVENGVTIRSFKARNGCVALLLLDSNGIVRSVDLIPAWDAETLTLVSPTWEDIRLMAHAFANRNS